MTTTRAAITGVAGYVPDYVLTNKKLETMVDTNDEWITDRTGIQERRILKGEGQGTSQLAIPAVNKLMEKVGMKPEEIELIICCTTTPDMLFPATANIIGAGVGATNAYGFDLGAACSGFLYGLHTASRLVESGAHKKVVVVGADKMSSIIDYEDRATCIIFGDGAGAVLVEPTEEEVGLMGAHLRSDGTGEKHLHMKAGGSRKPASHKTVDAKEHYVYQEGRAVFKFAVTNMADAVQRVMDEDGLKGEDIAYLVPHQANKRIIDAIASKMGLPEEQVMITIHKYGNTTAATIPLCLIDYEEKLKKGDSLMLTAFGGGFTWGAIHLKWAYNS